MRTSWCSGRSPPPSRATPVSQTVRHQRGELQLGYFVCLLLEPGKCGSLYRRSEHHQYVACCRLSKVLDHKVHDPQARQLCEYGDIWLGLRFAELFRLAELSISNPCSDDCNHHEQAGGYSRNGRPILC